MDILIKGMEMPKTCRRCMEMEIPIQCRVKKEEPITAVMSGYNRPSDCPLVAIPEHGDLIERDKLIGKASDECGGMSYEDALHVVLRCIENAPVILESSK